jgi:hypothetical protein
VLPYVEFNRITSAGDFDFVDLVADDWNQKVGHLRLFLPFAAYIFSTFLTGP